MATTQPPSNDSCDVIPCTNYDLLPTEEPAGPAGPADPADPADPAGPAEPARLARARVVCTFSFEARCPHCFVHQVFERHHDEKYNEFYWAVASRLKSKPKQKLKAIVKCPKCDREYVVETITIS